MTAKAKSYKYFYIWSCMSLLEPYNIKTNFTSINHLHFDNYYKNQLSLYTIFSYCLIPCNSPRIDNVSPPRGIRAPSSVKNPKIVQKKLSQCFHGAFSLPSSIKQGKCFTSRTNTISPTRYMENLVVFSLNLKRSFEIDDLILSRDLFGPANSFFRKEVDELLHDFYLSCRKDQDAKKKMNKILNTYSHLIAADAYFQVHTEALKQLIDAMPTTVKKKFHKLHRVENPKDLVGEAKEKKLKNDLKKAFDMLDDDARTLCLNVIFSCKKAYTNWGTPKSFFAFVKTFPSLANLLGPEHESFTLEELAIRFKLAINYIPISDNLNEVD